MKIEEIYKKADRHYPTTGPSRLAERSAYVQGYLDALDEMTKAPPNFYEQLAIKLRELWPTGEKDGKYPWRESVSNLTKRLEILWKDRDLKDKYSLDQCLSVARKYLAQYENNAKYMQTLKYFIYKQTKLVEQNTGKINYIYKSTFADMLENNPLDEAQNEWTSIFESNSTYEEGELI